MSITSRRTALAVAPASLMPALNTLTLPAAASASGMQVAHFEAQIEGVQTTKWSSYSDSGGACHGRHITKGDGTEVLRFDSGKPQKLVVTQVSSGMVDFKYMTFDPYATGSPLGYFTAMRVTRHGKIVNSTTGGWCGTAQATTTGPYDCGQRHDSGHVLFSPTDTRHNILVEAFNSTFGFKPYKNCPVVTPAGVSSPGFTSTLGRLSPRLIFGHQHRIVVEDGKVYRLNAPGGARESLSTTHIRLVLVRQR